MNLIIYFMKRMHECHVGCPVSNGEMLHWISQKEQFTISLNWHIPQRVLTVSQGLFLMVYFQIIERKVRIQEVSVVKTYCQLRGCPWKDILQASLLRAKAEEWDPKEPAKLSSSISKLLGKMGYSQQLPCGYSHQSQFTKFPSVPKDSLIVFLSLCVCVYLNSLNRSRGTSCFMCSFHMTQRNKIKTMLLYELSINRVGQMVWNVLIFFLSKTSLHILEGLPTVLLGNSWILSFSAWCSSSNS